MPANSLKSGFIPDIVCTLGKYSLEDYSHRFVATGLFPTKAQWKEFIVMSLMAKQILLG